MVVDSGTASAAIREWLQENVTGNRPVSDDELLIENGVLTSLQTVELVMFMEDRFGIVVEDDELDEDTFATVQSIASLVESKTA